MSKDKKSMAWGWIIFWIIIFWPVGIIFLVRKINNDKTATLKKAKTVAIISYVLMFFGFVYLMAAVSTDSNAVTPAIIFGGGGILVWIISKKMKKKAEKYKKYIDIVVNQSQSSIDYISSAVGVSYEAAVKDLQEMIDAGYFADAYINEGIRIIVLPQMASQFIIQMTTTQTQTQTQPKVVVCSSCGANNTIIAGRINECEYCGSPLQ